MCASRARRENYLRWREAHFPDLDAQLVDGCREAQRTQGVGTAVGYQIRPSTRGAQLLRDHGNVLALAPRARPVDGRAKQLVQEEVAVGPCRRLSAQDEVAGQATGRGGGRRLTAVVGLRRPAGDKAVAAPGQGVPDKELELARLVAAGREAREVVALHENARPAQGRREARQLMERRWEKSEAPPGKSRQLHVPHSFTQYAAPPGSRSMKPYSTR